jgi:hypothetical protein
MYKENKLWSSSLLPPSKTLEFITSQLVVYFQCPFSFAYIVINFGCCCSCCSYSTKIKEGKKVVAIQEHKKPTSKKCQEFKAKKKLPLSTLNDREQFFF